MSLYVSYEARRRMALSVAKIPRNLSVADELTY